MRAVDAKRDEHFGTDIKNLRLQVLKQFLAIKSSDRTCLEGG